MGVEQAEAAASGVAWGAARAKVSGGRRWRFGPLWLSLPGVAFLLLFLVYPGLQLLSLSLFDPSTGAFSLASYKKLGASPVYLRVLMTTFSIASETTTLCVLLGYPIASWLVGQPPRRRQALMLMVLLPFWTSPLVLNFAWLVLLGRNGAVVHALAALGVAHPPDLLFNRGTVVFSLVHSMMPLAIVTMLPVMGQIDERLGQAAATLGATASQAFWRVTLPLSMPGVAASGLLVFINTIGFFITPAILGGPRDTMLSQLIINQIQGLQNWPFGSTLAALLIGTSLLTCLIYDRVFGLSSVSGAAAVHHKGAARLVGLQLAGLLGDLFDAVGRLAGHRRLGWLLPTYAVALITVSLAPIVAFVPMGFTSSTFLSFPPPGFSTQWFVAYVQSPVWMAATLRSFAIGVVTAVLTLVLASLGAIGVSRARGPLGGVSFLFFLMPMVVPPIVIAISLFYLFAHVGLVATDLGIVIGHTVMAVPIAFVVLLATLKSYDWRLNEAAATLGAGRAQVLRRIMAPLVRPGLFAAFIFAFLQSFQELTVALFIGGGLKTTLPKQMWDSITLSVTPTLAAASVVMMVVVTGLFIAADRLRWSGKAGI